MQKNSIMLVIASTVIVSALLAFGWLFRMPEHVRLPGIDNTGSPDAVSVSGSPQSRPSGGPIIGQSSEFIQRDKQGRIAWILHSTSIMLKDAEKKLEASGVECTFYGEGDQPVGTVLSDGATMNTATQDMWFHGPVRANSPKGETFYVKNLRYDGTRKKFFGKGDVKLTRGTSVLTGDRLEADPNLKTMQVTGHVRVVLRNLAVRPGASAAPSASISPSARAEH